MIAALLMLAQVTLAPTDPAPLETTIAAVHANPKKFGGQLVRLHGYVSSCGVATCIVSERPKNAPGGEGQELSLATDAKFDAVVRPIVPTYVEFDARVDATCLQSACPALNVVTLRGVVSPEPPPFEKP